MSIFKKYCSYYDLIYKDKDYTVEVEYITDLIRKYHPGAKSILNLGCGTGKHDLLLAENGYDITGIDMSEEMMKIAEGKIVGCKSENLRISFKRGDIRNIRLDKQFDVVISLFHVMSYQTSDGDISDTFKTAGLHLKKGGFFFFDCWYGPAVLTDRPRVRVKRIENQDIKVTRIAEPLMKINENLVHVNYDIFIKNKKSGLVDEFKETHMMRYFFMPEIHNFFSMNRMEVIFSCEFLTGREPGNDTWGVCFGGRKIKD